MRLLLCLADHAGEVVSIDELLDQVWSGVNVSPDSVYQAVASLRRVLEDDPRQPTYIATVPRLGYRLLAPVSFSMDAPMSSATPFNGNSPPPTGDGRAPAPFSNLKWHRNKTARLLWIAAVATFLFLAIASWAFLFKTPTAAGRRPIPPLIESQAQRIAVLPFLDLTQGMKEEEFADGMTEELIDRLSKIPGLQVPSATSSFYFKGKQIPMADIAKSMGAIYVLDGSVRKSGSTVRVAARLSRAENGFVIWSETYDRPFNDLLMVQDDIAIKVSKALQATIERPALAKP